MNRSLFTRLALLLIAAVFVAPGKAQEVKQVSAAKGSVTAFALHPLFTEGAVLQRQMPIPIWGTAPEGTKVTVTLAGKTETATAKDGKWMVKLPALEAGGPHVLRVEGPEKREVKDILIGEVWLCSGQSNMAFTLGRAHNAIEAIAGSANPNIRLFSVPRVWEENKPQATVAAAWKPCNPNTSGSFTAVGYFFGRDLQKALGVPVGLIDSSVGGTPAQSWMSEPVLRSLPEAKEILTTYEDMIRDKDKFEAKYASDMEAYKARKAEVQKTTADKAKGMRAPAAPLYRSSKQPYVLYNNMIHPLVPFAMRGAIWYQGEANSANPELYRVLLPAMINNWRKDFNPELAFYIAQLAPYDRPSPEAWAWFRDAQARIAKDVPNAGIAANPDAGDPTDIHPTRKEPVGQRLALAALAKTYGQKIEWSGPTFKEGVFIGAQVKLNLEHADGLKAEGGKVTGFTIAGEDRQFHPAEAKLVNNAVEVSSDKVPAPVAVRYAWKNMPDGNLWNAAGLPAAPFRTDNWPNPANTVPTQAGFVKSEFIFDQAPHPQCHASTIVETKTGLVAAWFGGTKEGNPDVGIWLSRQEKGEWTAPVEVANGAETEDPRRNCLNPVLFQVPNGRLQLYYKTGEWWAYLKESGDGGKTWSKAKRLPNGFIGPVKNKPVMLTDGSILSPSSSEYATPQGRAWRLQFERSTDAGQSWQLIGPVNDGLKIQSIQPSILIHPGNKLQAIGRTMQGKLFDIWSEDNGQTWGKMSLLTVPNNNSGTDAVTLKDGRHLLVYNHTGNNPGGKHPSGFRSPLNVALSENGKAWQSQLVLENTPKQEFSYPAVIQTADGLVHITYTWKRLKIKHVVLDPSKLLMKTAPDNASATGQ